MLHLRVGADFSGLRLFKLNLSLCLRLLKHHIGLLGLHVLRVLQALTRRLLRLGVKISRLRLSNDLLAIAILLPDQNIGDSLQDHRVVHDHLLDVWRLRLAEELLGVIPAHRLHGVSDDSLLVKQFGRTRHDLHQSRDLHDTLRMAGRVRIGLRRQLIILNGPQKRLRIPIIGGLLVALPEAFRVVLERPHQQPELFGLRRVHPLVNGVQHLGGLVDHGQRRADRRIGAAFAHLAFACPANPHASLRHVINKRHQSLRRSLIRQRHYSLIDR